jgi:hypothetical protein
LQKSANPILKILGKKCKSYRPLAKRRIENPANDILIGC